MREQDLADERLTFGVSHIISNGTQWGEKSLRQPKALTAARAYMPDLIMLDRMRPGMGGIEVLTRLRHESEVYVIILMAKSEITNKIVGLSVGVDDYLTNPSAPASWWLASKQLCVAMSNQPANPKFIVTIRGVSYRFEDEPL